MPLMSGKATRFVGRESELRALTAHSEGCRSEASATVMICGDAGVGKTRLITEFAATRPRGAVFVGGCLELGVDGLAYAPFTSLFRQILREHGRAPFERSGSGDVGELSRILPELGPLPEGRPESRSVLFDQVLGAIRTVAREREGLTLVVEDLHWADGATRDLLVFLVRNLDRPGVQIITTHRPGDLHGAHPLRPLLPELERLPEVTRLDLPPLTRREVGRQAHALTGAVLDPAALDELHRRSDGIPLYVEALSAVPGGGGPVPDRFRDLLLAPVDRLPASWLRVLRTASVGALSGEVGHEPLRRVTGLSEAETEEILQGLVDSGLLRISGEGYRFRHALLREAVYGTLLPGVRSRAHLRFARDLEEHIDAVPGERRAAEQAHHYQAAHELPRALASAWAAAVQAGRSLAFEERLAVLERVLGLWGRVPEARELVGGLTLARVRAEAALAALESGRSERALELCDTALAEVSEAPDDEELALRALLLRCRGQARTRCLVAGAEEDLAEALRLHPPHMPGYGTTLSIVARESMFRPGETLGLGLTAVSLAERALEVSVEAGDRSAEAAALISLGTMDMSRGRVERGERALLRAAALSREISDPMMEARASGNLAHCLRERGRTDEALEFLERSRSYQLDRGTSSLRHGFTLQNLGEVYFDLGLLSRAREVVEEAAPRASTPMHRVFLRSLLSRTLVALGETGAAREELSHEDVVRARAGLGRMGRVPVLSVERLDQAQVVMAAHLDLYLAEDDSDAAGAEAGEALRRLVLSDSPGFGWPLLSLIAEVTRRGGDAAPSYDRVRPVVASMPVHGPVQEAFRADCLARLAEAEHGPGDTAVEAWETAVGAWGSTPMPLHGGWARLHAAEVDASRGVRGPAGEAALDVGETAEGYGAGALEQAATDLARRLGAISDERGRASAPAGLTPREVEVLRLLAEGATNARIAEALFISPKTASVHVSNILAKLDVPNRATAGAQARRLGVA
ncbi:helix-turn-helix transcriptional regulator [Nocardiopsis alba]|uniref:helix-turn-helix transcriptional regulator n=1 Tax=Nocardiopsis alba TaxID=53437 RepID=UPI0033B95CDB